MKAEIEKLENDFSKQTLDDLVNQQLAGSSVSMDDKPSDLNNGGVSLDQENKADNGVKRRGSNFLELPINELNSSGSNKSEGSILYGKEYLNNSQQTIRSLSKSSLFSNSHYGNFDPDGEWVSVRSGAYMDESNEMILEKDTLDLINPDLGRWSSFKGVEMVREMCKGEDEKQLDGVDDEWCKFINQAKHEGEGNSASDGLVTRKMSGDNEKLRLQYYRNLVQKDILELTEK